MKPPFIGPIPSRYCKELAMILHRSLSRKPFDRPVIAELLIDPLFKPFITLKPFEERILNQSTTNKLSYYEGFLVREDIFVGKRKSERGVTEFAIIND